MPVDQRDSPRAAIRSWLRYTDSGSKPEPIKSPVERGERSRSRRQHLNTADHIEERSLEYTHQIDDGDRSKHSLHRGRGNEPRRGTNNVPEMERAKEQTLSKQALELRPGDPGFAEYLGLHAPFRNFKARSDDLEADPGRTARPRKRKRRESSTSSYLEPARLDSLTTNEHAYHDSGDEIEAAKERSRHHEIDSAWSSSQSQPSAVAEPPRRKQSESYDRRPRHKTREDRYELKATSSTKRKKPAKKARKDGEERRSKRQKHKEKSGAALMHSFTAQNVAHDRLTLQPAKKLGLFGKGRASSPVRRRGLPDLAFNEMTFLNSRRAKPDEHVGQKDSKPYAKKTRRQSTKAADTEAEISRYFTSAKATARDASDHRADGKQHESTRRTQIHDSPPAFVDLPDHAFLGFGSCGVDSVSPVKRLDSRGLKNLERKLARSPTRSTNYLTWSQNGLPSQASLHRDKQPVVPLRSSKYSNRRRNRSISTEAATPKDPLSSSRASDVHIAEDNAANSINPQSKESPSTAKATDMSIRPNKRSRGAISPSHSPQKRGETRSDSEGAPLRSVQTIALGHRHESEHPRSAPRGSQKKPSRDSTDRSARAKRGKGFRENGLHAIRAGTGQIVMDQAALDLPDNMIDDLLQDCKSQSNAEALGPEPEHLEQSDSEVIGPFTVCESTSFLYERFQGVEHNPHGDPMLEVKSPATRPVSYSEPLNLRDQHHSVYKELRPQRLAPTHAASRHGINSFNRPKNMGDTPEQAQTSRTPRGDSSSAWSGYNTIYKCQQDAAQVALAANEVYSMTHEAPHQESSMHPYMHRDVLTYPKCEPYTNPVDVGYDVINQGAERKSYADRYEIDAGDPYPEQEGLQENIWLNDSAWQNTDYDEQPSIGNTTHEYDNSIERRELNRYQTRFKQTIGPQGFEHHPSTTHFSETCPPRRSEQTFTMPGNGHEIREETTKTYDENDPPELAGFWTPRMGY